MDASCLITVLTHCNEFRGQYIKIELLQYIQASISQLESGTGIGHDAAKADVLERVAN